MKNKGLEQLLYHRDYSLNSAPKGQILHGAHQVTRQLAYTHLQPNPDVKPKSKLKPKSKRPKAKAKAKAKADLSETDLPDSGSCFAPDSNDYWDSDLEFPENNPAVWHDLAVVALKYYNEKQGVKLELNGRVSACPVHYGGGVGFHLGFEANDSTGLPKKMFAEIFQSDKNGKFDKNGECKVVICEIMDPNDPDVLKGCRFCGTAKLHPKGMKFFRRPYEWSDANV